MIVGGGISGLAAAFFLRDRGLTVTVLEGSPRLGGKLAVSEVAGIDVDEGAEALLARRPEGTDLIGAVGLAGQLVPPGTTAAWIWTRGRLHPLPKRQVMGVPADLDELARLRDPLPAGTGPGPGRSPAAAHGAGRRRVGGQLRRGEIRPGARGPAGGSAARRGLRGPVAASCPSRRRWAAWRRRAAAPLAGRGGRVAAARPGDRLRARRCSPRWPAVSARCRPPSRPRPGRRCGPAR